MIPTDTIHPALATALAQKGYETLTPVQLSMLAEEAAGRDLLVSAQTGSGKTVAFGMAIAPTLLGEAAAFDEPSSPLALVIAPTRELALQVQRELQWLYAETGARIAAGVGGMDARTERRALERGAHIVVGTPGRLRDHITRGALDLGHVRAVVLDEADEMLDLGFREDLEFILGSAPDSRRTLLFSATVPRAIADLASDFQNDALRVVATGAGEQHADIEYVQIVVRNDEKEHAVINTLLLHDASSAMVFCHTRESVKHLAARLANRGFAVVSLSGELSQAERTSALQAMRDGRARVCVATDVAARGIDLPNLDLVVHADIPSNPETLLHRSGRTGRAGRKGLCALIVPLHRRNAATRVLRAANLDASTRAAPGIAEIEAHQRQSILAAAEGAVGAEDLDPTFVAALLERVTPEQLAAAYLRRELATRPLPEEVSDDPIPPERPRREKRDADAPRGKPEPMADGQWFTLSIGRDRRADPKWLLPMICRAGGVSKRDVGSIKIGDNETRFEISPNRAASFAAALAQVGGMVENGITISPAGAFAPSGKPRRDNGPRYKIRSDKGAKLSSRPASEVTPPIERTSEGWAGKPKGKFGAKPRSGGSDKVREDSPKAGGGKTGKPARPRRDKPAEAGAAPRSKRPKSFDPLD